MALTDEEIVRFREHMAAKAPNFACPACQTMGWRVIDIATLPLRSGHEGEVFVISPDRSLPVVAIACRQCAFVAHFAWQTIKRGP